MKTQILFFTLFICMSSAILGQNTIHVPDDFETIQEGIDAATDGDTVLVSQGIYTENINYYSKAITVTSHYIHTLDSADIYNTIIDGSQAPDPHQGSVVYFTSGEDTTSVLCGFTIQKGTGTYPDSFGDRSGGGILLEFSGGKIIHNIIINNKVENTFSSGYGGGICKSSYGDEILVVRDNIIAGNETNTFSSQNFVTGGGIAIFGYFIVQGNIITDNYVFGKGARGGGVSIMGATSEGIINNNEIINNKIEVNISSGMGGGIHLGNPASELIVSNNTITGNICTGTSYYKGGGISVGNWGAYGDFRIEGNIISDNVAYDGGGIYLSVSEPGCLITNNLIYNNQAYNRGGGIYGWNTSGDKQKILSLIRVKNNNKKIKQGKNYELPMIVNNTFIHNKALLGGGIYNGFDENDLEVVNNVIYHNVAGTGAELYTQYMSSNTYLNYNNINPDLVYGNWSGSDNIFANPLFENEENGDFHILEGSPCIDAGDPDYKFNADDTEPDIGAYYLDQRPIKAQEATEISNTAFRANWEEAEGATSYLLDVAHDAGFTNMLDDYCNREVCSAHSCMVVGLTPSTTYYYRVRANYYWGRSGYSDTTTAITLNVSVQDLSADGTERFNIYPNPVSSTTGIFYSLNQKSQVVLEICAIKGECILQLVNKMQAAGEYHMVFDASCLPAGIYFCTLKTNDPAFAAQTKKLIKLE